MAEPRNANDPPSLERERIMIPSIRHKVDPVKGPLALVFLSRETRREDLRG